MEYERIHKVQSGIISPSKLRLKLLGSQNHNTNKDLSNNNSSPSRIQHDTTEFLNNSLLPVPNPRLFQEQDSSIGVPPIKCDSSTKDSSNSEGNSLQSKELPPRDYSDTGRFRSQPVPKGDTSSSTSVHPGITFEDENLDYDSTSSFEFQKGERSLHHSLNRSFSRPVSSKWNDAEKWIMNRQNGEPNISKKANLQNRQAAANMVRLLPENSISGNKLSVKKVDFCQTGSNMGKFSSLPGRGNGVNQLIDICPESKDLKEVETTALPCTKSVTEESIGILAVRSVSMRDMGTEMTPIPSQEPSRSATPVSSTTPLRSPNSSLPSTPRRREPGPTPIEQSISNETQHVIVNGKTGLSEQELKIKTRQEIVALGVQLGKMNIAEWASKDGKERRILGNETDLGELECIENEKRAAAWEEAEKSKHAARFKREEIRIEAWESREKAKLEAEMRKVEAKAEHLRAQAEADMVKKIAMASQKSEEKRAAAEARKNRLAEKTAAQADYIRETGRIPSSSFVCCGWS